MQAFDLSARKNEQRKAASKQPNGLKFSQTALNYGSHKKEHGPFWTRAHSECTPQRNRYTINKLGTNAKW